MYKVLGHAKCKFCKEAIVLLASKGREFVYLDAKRPSSESIVSQLKKDGFTSVPQIWFEDNHVGGYSELVKRLN